MRINFRDPKRALMWLLAALVETATVTPALMLLYGATGRSDWPQLIPSAWVLVAGYLASALWEARDKEGNRHASVRLLALGVGVLLQYSVVFFSLPYARDISFFSLNAALLVVPVAAHLWYQGARLGAEGVASTDAVSRFPFQVGAVLGGIFVARWMGLTAVPRGESLLVWSALLLFGAGLPLLMISSARAVQSRVLELGDHEQGGLPFRPLVIGLVTTLVLVAMFSFNALSLAQIALWLHWLSRPLVAVYGWGVWVLVQGLTLLGWLIEPLLTLLIRWLKQLVHAPVPPLLGSAGLPPEGAPDSVNHPVLVYYAGLLLKLSGLLLAMTLTGLWLNRLRRLKRTNQAEEERINLGLWTNLGADLLNLLRRRGRQVGSPEVVDRADGDLVRQLFRQLQVWGAAAGRAREESETPSAYAHALAEAHPTILEAAEAITIVYNQARYGSIPPRSEAVEKAVSAAERYESEQALITKGLG
jgi:hypothetical protein